MIRVIQFSPSSPECGHSWLWGLRPTVLRTGIPALFCRPQDGWRRSRPQPDLFTGREQEN